MIDVSIEFLTKNNASLDFSFIFSYSDTHDWISAEKDIF
jgi:hypothetical protein